MSGLKGPGHGIKQHVKISNKQRGAALLVFFILVGIGVLALFAGNLNVNKTQLERERITRLALAQTKDALISWSAARGDLVSNARPGELPCPDTNNDGNENYPCGAGARGRIPWKTLGIPEPKDGYGETLWYAISGNFRKRTVNNIPINSDTKATLKVYAPDGTTLLTPTGSEAVAVIFSPGPAMAGQNRNAAGLNTAANYLESTAGRNNATTGGPYIAGTKSSTFNDELVFITTRELMTVVERRVAGEVLNLLKEYHTTNGYYPYPAAYNDPLCQDTGASAYLTQCYSDAAKCRGRLPQTALYPPPAPPPPPPPLTPDWNGATFPGWLSYNLWNQVIYYAVGTNGLKVAPPSCSSAFLTVNTTSVTALFFMPGPPLGGITRPSTNLNDYLEDAANQDGWTGAPPAADSYVTPSVTSNDLLRTLP